MDIKLNLSYYASIMLDAFKDLLCLKLCWHNRPGPTFLYAKHNVRGIFNNMFVLLNFKKLHYVTKTDTTHLNFLYACKYWYTATVINYLKMC